LYKSSVERKTEGDLADATIERVDTEHVRTRWVRAIAGKGFEDHRYFDEGVGGGLRPGDAVVSPS